MAGGDCHGLAGGLNGARPVDARLSKWRHHAAKALADLGELLRYFGPALAAAGWNGCNLLRTRVTAAQGKAATIRRLAEAQGGALKQWA